MGDRLGLRRLAVVAALLVAGGVAAEAPALGQTVTATQLQALADRAASGDARALAELRAVRQVDGRPVDVGRALAGAEGPELTSRLRALADGPRSTGVPPVAAADARAEAASVLEGRRFRDPRVPRPLQGVLRALGRWLEPLTGPLRAAWRRVDGNVPVQLALVAAVFTAALAITYRLIGRRGAQTVRRLGAIDVDGRSLDPDDLEREAASAEREGDLERAFRLRFLAGVLRLDRAGVISYRPSLTTGQLQARIGSTAFAGLARAFDEIAYGGRPAADADVEAAKATWPRVLVEARR